MFVEITPAAGEDAAMDFDESKYPKFSEIDPANATPEQVTELVKAGQTLLGQTKHWHGKATSVKPKEEVINPKPTADPDIVGSLQSDVAELKTEREKRQFGHAHGLSPEEVDRAFALATGMNKKPKEVLEDQFFKAGLETLRKQQRANGAIPGPSNRSPMVDGKPFNEMKREDKIKNFGALVASKQKN